MHHRNHTSTPLGDLPLSLPFPIPEPVPERCPRAGPRAESRGGAKPSKTKPSPRSCPRAVSPSEVEGRWGVEGRGKTQVLKKTIQQSNNKTIQFFILLNPKSNARNRNHPKHRKLRHPHLIMSRLLLPLQPLQQQNQNPRPSNHPNQRGSIHPRHR